MPHVISGAVIPIMATEVTQEQGPTVEVEPSAPTPRRKEPHAARQTAQADMVSPQ